MNAFVRAVDRLSTLAAVIASVFLAAAAVIVCWMVIYRTTGHSTFWELESAVYLMVAAVFLGSPYCLATKGHVGVDLLAHYLPTRHQQSLERAIILLGLLVCLYLTGVGIELTLHSIGQAERTGSLWNPPKWPLFAMMPIGFGLTCLQYIAEFVRPLAPKTPGHV